MWRAGVACLLVFLCLPAAKAHGRLIEPPSRASMWRYGFNSPPDYNDHESYCGGFTRQWVRNNGRCGICGDAWDSPEPRPHEAGGTYGQGIIVRRYKKGAAFTIRVEVTANHRGHFEFRLCKHNAPTVVATQHCLDQYVLQRAKTTAENNHTTRLSNTTLFYQQTKQFGNDWFNTDDILNKFQIYWWYYAAKAARYFIGSESKVYEMRYVLPPDLTCSQCVLQWRYLAANNWGRCDNGTSAVGCGPQEEFRACADVAIEAKDGSSDDKPYRHDEPKDGGNENDLNTNRVDGIYTEKQGNLYLLSLTIMLIGMFLAIFVFTLIFIYFYGVNKTVKPCWKLTTKGVRQGLRKGKGVKSPPVPPPRTKKYPSLNTEELVTSLA